ncbi:MAG: branched-chain amino acid transaminase [Acidobacteria bacterium]|nr:branched-chain amino acid transaminase [Acidobacteriota bacterium]
MNGQLVEFEKATVHVFSHGLHYGSGAFEGIRCYQTPHGPAIFRLPEHLDRLAASCKIYRTDLPYTLDELTDAITHTIVANEFDECYIRPLVYRGLGTLGVYPGKCPVDVAIGVWPWGAYLGEEALRNGVDVCVSSWRRAAGSTFPSLAKATGNYLSSQLIKMDAMANGFSEGIALGVDGNVSEGSGENLFVVFRGELLTPPLAASVLPGITRDSIFQIAKDLGIPVREAVIPREMLYIAEEVFFCGTAAEVTPIRSIDRIAIGEGRPGPITLQLMDEYLGIAKGRIEDRHGWLCRVEAKATV